jgi:quercetin dioxygenase-like cupin family protein
MPRRDVVIQPPGAGDATWFLDNLLVTKVSGRDGAAVSVLEARLPAGSRTPFHRHETEDEAYYVLDAS